MSYDVFSGVDIPKKANRGATAKYPTEQLEVGQCFFEKIKEEEDGPKAVKRMIGATQRVRKLHPDRKFSARATLHPHTGEEVVGVWRTE